MVWQILLGPITDLIKKVLDKVASDKMPEETRAQLELEMRRLAEQELRQQEDRFRQFVLRYEGAGKDMPRVIQVLRGSVRPVLTYVLVAAWIWGYVYGFLHPTMDTATAAKLTEMMAMLYYLNIISLGFWYGERLITRTGLLDAFKARRRQAALV
jgi:hypothetical protein